MRTLESLAASAFPRRFSNACTTILTQTIRRVHAAAAKPGGDIRRHARRDARCLRKNARL
jgi:hypothetical protein